VVYVCVCVRVVLCPAGTHLSGDSCVQCEPGTYNDRDGQTSCTDCPDSESSSPAGSIGIHQCTHAYLTS